MLSCNGIVLNYAFVMYNKSISKIDIVQSIAKELPVPPVMSYFLCDCWYVSEKIINTFAQRGFHTIGALKTNRLLYPSGMKKKLRELAAELSVTHREFDLVTVKKRNYYVYRYEGNLNGIENAVVLLSYPEKAFGNPKALRAFISTNVALSTQEILSWYVCRWPIEVFFRQCKEKLALDGYQIRSAQGIKRASSSASKGESVADTIRVVSAYCDIIAMRHPKEGAPLVATMHSLVPVINAGDGGHNHPTQTLTDLMTIHKEKGHVDNLTVGFCGDLKFGRTVHSLVAAMSRYTGISFVFVSPEELKLPRYVKEQYIKEKNIPYTQSASLEEVMPELDVLYMTRVQKERFFNEEDYLRLKDSYILTPDKLANAKKDLCILHPLPRVNEISVAVDDDPRACYFKQAQNGRYIRMALIMKLLGIA